MCRYDMCKCGQDPLCHHFVLASGEGMKIGALALLRNKRHVSVQTSQDSWRFGLKQHSLLQEEVLTVFVSGEFKSLDIKYSYYVPMIISLSILYFRMYV